MMRQRDKAIIDDLARFRCLSRDDITELHFKGLKNATTCANTVLKRLRRDGHITANTTQQPYIYFNDPSPIRKDSQKIPHFLAIVDFYKQIRKYKEPEMFIVEPKLSKGLPEADCFMLFKGTPFMIEIQRNHYSSKVIAAKIQRYERYFASNEWRKEHWQPKGNEIFPYVWFITETKYNLKSKGITFLQSRNVKELLK